MVGPARALARGAPATPAFAHNAEHELAALFDFYGVAWEYEPHTFVLETGADGCPTLAFTPDFYLPELDRYVEVTTLDQKLVTRKNRKVRRLRELHPGIDVQVVYRRDYLELLIKYGLARPEQVPDGPRVVTTAAEPPGLLTATVVLAHTDLASADEPAPGAGRRPSVA